MRKFNQSLPAFAASLSLSACLFSSCDNLVDVELQLTEPCNQVGQALNGVGSLRISVDGIEQPMTSEITIDGNPDDLFLGTGDSGAVITVEGFAGRADTDGAQVFTAPAQSIGRSIPILINDNSEDVQATLLMGLRDGVAQTTKADGTCSEMDNLATVKGRHGHTATYIPEINKILIAGGAVWTDAGESLLRSVELYDPATGLYENVGDLPTTRAYHTATYVGNGQVFLAGGFGVIGSEVTALATTIIYDANRPVDAPYDDRLPPLVNLRALHTASFVAGKVILVGGCVGCTPQSIAQTSTGDPASLVETIEIFDIAAGQAFAPSAQLVVPRALHAMSVLEGGNKILVSGGVNGSGPVCNVELFELQGDTLVTLDARLGGQGNNEFSSCPYGHAQVDAGANRIAFIGGRTNAPGGQVGGPVSSQVLFWNSIVGIEPGVTNLTTGRYQPEAHALDNGEIIILGGEIEVNGATAEKLVAEGIAYVSAPLRGPPSPDALQKAASVKAPNDQIYVFGGYTREIETRASGFVYIPE